MPRPAGYPQGVPAWVDTAQPDPDAAASFYAGLFGWRFEDRGAAGTPYLVASLDGRDVAAIGSASMRVGRRATWNTYVAVDDADASADRVRAAGGSVVDEPFDLFGLSRVARCVDPGGAEFGLWQPRAIARAQSVNAPGTWNFSELNTADVEASTGFYAALFGWEVDEVDMGAMKGTMVRLPGYADFLEELTPGTKQRHLDFGAPPGFTECVAWFLPLNAGEAPHWSITFAIADADEVAARARDLGGSVLVAPHDLPMVRSTVIRDPGGAVFTANAFNPGG
jgi:predicted enzyme related to lactoylglutathione lyase